MHSKLFQVRWLMKAHNGVILTHSSKGPELSLRGQCNGKWAYLWRSNV